MKWSGNHGVTSEGFVQRLGVSNLIVSLVQVALVVTVLDIH
jgi:hypothetical protein